jgi:hypothetical protein
MKNDQEKKLFNSLLKRLNDLWYDHEVQSAITLCYADPSQFDHGHPDFKNLEKLQEQLRPLLIKFM